MWISLLNLPGDTLRLMAQNPDFYVQPLLVDAVTDKHGSLSLRSHSDVQLKAIEPESVVCTK